MFDPCANDLRETGEEVNPGRGELVAGNEPTVVSKAFLDAIVVKGGECN